MKNLNRCKVEVTCCASPRFTCGLLLNLNNTSCQPHTLHAPIRTSNQALLHEYTMAFVSNAQQVAASPALALRNLGLAPGDLMAQINQMNRMRPDITPPFNPIPHTAPSYDRPLQEFTRFSELPTELRLKICRFWGRDLYHDLAVS